MLLGDEILDERVVKNFASVFLVHIFKNIKCPVTQLRKCRDNYYSSPAQQKAFVEENMYWATSKRGMRMIEVMSDCLGVDAKTTVISLLDKGQQAIDKLNKHESEE